MAGAGLLAASCGGGGGDPSPPPADPPLTWDQGNWDKVSWQ